MASKEVVEATPSIQVAIREEIDTLLATLPETEEGLKIKEMLEKYKEFIGMSITIELGDTNSHEMVFIPFPGKPLFVSKNLITRGDFNAVMVRDRANCKHYPEDDFNQPMEDASWHDWNRFCNEVNNTTVRSGLSDRSRSERESWDKGQERNQGVRRWGFGALTEAEWRFIFGNGEDRKHPDVSEWLFDEGDGPTHKIIYGDEVGEGLVGDSNYAGFRLAVDASDVEYIDCALFHHQKFPHLDEENEVFKKQRKFFDEKIEKLHQLREEATAWWSNFQETVFKKQKREFKESWEWFRNFFKDFFGRGFGFGDNDVESKAHLSELEKARLKYLHRLLAKKLHPDKTKKDDGTLFREIQEAYENQDLARLEEMAKIHLSEEELQGKRTSN